MIIVLDKCVTGLSLQFAKIMYFFQIKEDDTLSYINYTDELCEYVM